MLQLTIPLPKTESKRLQQAALRYGFSVDELSRKIIADATKQLLDVPEESLGDYENPKEIVKAFRDAMKAYKEGKLLDRLN